MARPPQEAFTDADNRRLDRQVGSFAWWTLIGAVVLGLAVGILERSF